MKQRSIPMLAVFAASAAFPLTANAKLDDHILPKGAVSVCQRHIAGAMENDGTPGAHVVTHQYGSTQKVDAVLRFYEKRFRRAPAVEKDGTFVWELREDGAILHYSVHATDAGRFWYDCDTQPAGVRTVIFLSTMMSPKIRAAADN